MENNKDLEAKFNQAIEEWRKHCINNVNRSDFKSNLNCDAYRKIISMNTLALPLIRKAYDTEPAINSLSPIYSLKQLLKNAVLEIASPDFKIPKELCLQQEKMEEYTKKWLDENMDKYVRKHS